MLRQNDDPLMSARRAVLEYIDNFDPNTCHPDLYEMRALVRDKVNNADEDRLDRIASAIRLLARLPITNPFRN